MPPRHNFSEQELAAHQKFVYRVARELVTDTHVAEDLAQQAMAITVQHPPVHRRALRSWLGRIVRNLVVDRARRLPLEPELVSGADLDNRSATVQQRIELHEAVLRAVRGLDEPYRATVFRRFYDGLSVREIANEEGVSHDTVKTRLRRGIEMLRSRLDREMEGGRAAWVGVLASYAGFVRCSRIAVQGTIAMQTSAKLTLSVTAAVVAASITWWTLARESTEMIIGPGESSPEVLAAVGFESPEDRGELSSSDGEEKADPDPGEENEATHRVRGRVLDMRGQGVPGVAVIALDRDPGPVASDAGENENRTISGPAGAFAIEVAADAKHIAVVDARYTTVLFAAAQVDSSTETTVVVCPKFSIAGVVIDAITGIAIHRADVELLPPVELRDGISSNVDPRIFGEKPWVRDYCFARRWRVTTDVNGRFEVHEIPQIAGCRLRVLSAAYATVDIEAPTATRRDLEFELRRGDAAAATVHGVVIAGSGVVSGAVVSVGPSSTRTHRDGRFALRLDRRGTLPRIIATKPGYLPARMDLMRNKTGHFEGVSEEVVLRLGDKPLTIQGRARDADGRALSGVKVWIRDPEMFGVCGDRIVQVESMTEMRDPKTWHFVTTDADGCFEIGGMSDRSYHLEAIDPTTLLSASIPNVAAGSRGVTFGFPGRAATAHVRGRVVDVKGAPLGGVRLMAMKSTFTTKFGGQMAAEAERRAVVISAADGSFQLPPLPRDGSAFVRVTGDRVLPKSLRVGRRQQDEGVEIVLHRRRHVQVRLARADAADTIRVEGPDDEPQSLVLIRGASSMRVSSLSIYRGVSLVFAVPESAAMLVLQKGEDTVARVPLDLREGEVHVVHHQ